jgi:hypothetical protein
MVENLPPSLLIDLNEFKLHLHSKSNFRLIFHFNSPSRRFSLSLIVLVFYETKRAGRMKTIPVRDNLDLLVLLNESGGGAAGSSDQKKVFHRIYTKWKDALPNLEEAPLFKVLGWKKEKGDGTIGRA